MPVRLPCAKRKLRSPRSVEPGGIDRAGKIGHEHPIARDIQRDADPFHQMRQHDLRRLRLCIDGCTVHRVAARRVAAIGPVEDAIFAIELEIDRLRQVVEEYFDVGAVGGGLTLGDFDAGAKDSALLSIVRAFLRPVDLLALGVDGDPNAPPGLVAPIGVATARLDERFDLRAVEIRAHHAHPFAVAPVELAVFLIELDLLRRERDARRNDDPAILSVEIGALDGAIVCAGTGAHVGPVDMAGFDIDHDAIRKMTIGDDDLPVGAVRAHRVNTTTTQLENEQSANRAFAAGSGFRFRIRRQSVSHVVLLSPLEFDAELFPRHLSISVVRRATRPLQVHGPGEVRRALLQKRRQAPPLRLAERTCALNSSFSAFIAALICSRNGRFMSLLLACSAPAGFAANFRAVSVAVASRF